MLQPLASAATTETRPKSSKGDFPNVEPATPEVVDKVWTEAVFRTSYPALAFIDTEIRRSRFMANLPSSLPVPLQKGAAKALSSRFRSMSSKQTPKQLRQNLLRTEPPIRAEMLNRYGNKTTSPNPPDSVPPPEAELSQKHAISDEQWHEIVTKLEGAEEIQTALTEIQDQSFRGAMEDTLQIIAQGEKEHEYSELARVFDQLGSQAVKRDTLEFLSLLSLLSLGLSAVRGTIGSLADHIISASALAVQSVLSLRQERKLDIRIEEALRLYSQGVDPTRSILPNETEKSWTVMFYISGMNNLAFSEERAFRSLQKVGSDDNVNLVAQISTYGTKRGIISAEKEKNGLYPFVSEHLGVQKMSDPKVLKQSILWAMSKYPAKNFALVMMGHGGGHLGSMPDDLTKRNLQNRDLGKVLLEVEKETGRRVALVDFDACLMSQLEVYYDLHKGTDFVVASQEVESTLAMSLGKIVGATPQSKVMADLKQGIKERGEITPEELGRLYVHEMSRQFGAQLFSPTAALIRMSEISKLKESVDALATQLLESMEQEPTLKPKLQRLVNQTQHFLSVDPSRRPYEDYRDLGNFARRLCNDPKIAVPEIRERAAQVLQDLQNAVVTEHHVEESVFRKPMADASGISIFLSPAYSNEYAKKFFRSSYFYRDLTFAKDSAWEKFLLAVSNPDASLQGTKLVDLAKAGAAIFAQSHPYVGAMRLANLGGTGTGWFSTIVSPVAAAWRGWKSVQKFRYTQESQWPLAQKGKFYAGAALDAAMAMATAAIPFAQVFPRLAPLIEGVVGVGFARFVYGVSQGKLKSAFKPHKTIEEKLKAS